MCVCVCVCVCLHVCVYMYVHCVRVCMDVCVPIEDRVSSKSPQTGVRDSVSHLVGLGT